MGAGAISNSLFVDNDATADFFAVARAGAVACGMVTVSGCTFVGNRAVSQVGPGYGGAIGLFGVSTVEHCTLVGNSGGAPGGVGGIFVDAGVPATIRSVILAYTTAGQAMLGDGVVEVL